MIDQSKINECSDKIRFTIADRAGFLQFTKFEIVDEGACNEVENALRSYLLNRPLDEIDIVAIRHTLSGGHEDCVHAIEDTIKWFRPNKR